MIKILFICLGNICRSPMAQFVMDKMLRQEGCIGQVQVDSAGTSGENSGRGVYPQAKRKLEKQGIDCSGKRARQMERGDYGTYDLIIGMDASNMRNMLRICGGDPEGKMRLLMDFAGQHRDVDDPWYTGDFDRAYADIEAGCRGLMGYLRDNGMI